MPSHCIDHRWIDGAGPAFASRDPYTGEVCWRGSAAIQDEVNAAVAAARAAFDAWAHLSWMQRYACLEAFAERLGQRRQEVADAISIATGKPMWESLAEVDLMIGKAPVTRDAWQQRCGERRVELGDTHGITRYRPLGVLAVLGPFNMPGHLPNGHLMPALLAGNTAVLKPSEFAPHVGQRVMELWIEAGLPAGVINLVQGARDTGAALVGHADVDGVLFTGSYATGQALSRLLADRPEKMLALEMGGNNPLVVHEVRDIAAAAHVVLLSAYITAGQRCTCARWLILPRGSAGDQLLEVLAQLIARLRVGRYDDEPAPFMGPVINGAAAARLLDAQQALLDRGARALVAMQQLDSPGGALLRPGLLDVTDAGERTDEEWFGPLLQVIRGDDFDAAVHEANRTSYGLAAGLLSDDAKLYETFYQQVRAGVVNWNQQLTGASGRLPFGGVGRSGNHRPSGFHAVDYCASPVASLERDRLVMPEQLPPGIQA